MRYLYVRMERGTRFQPEMDPVAYYSELDEERFEVRKIHEFEDGRMEKCPSAKNYPYTWLSIDPIPDINEINSDSQFKASEIEKKEFDELWARIRD